MDGNGAGFEAMATKYEYSHGMLSKAYDRVVNALCDISDSYISWPTSSERQRLCNTGVSYGFDGCFFTVDGSTIPLAFKPSFDHEAFFDRKSRYSMNFMVTNDLNRRIINVVIGFPGSVHDARVLRAARYSNEALDALHFTGSQYGLGDSAFAPSARIIVPYKKPLCLLSENAEFNTRLARLRILSENTIGILKGRWQSLKNLRLRVRSPADVKKVCKHILACCVLHNVLQSLGDDWEELCTESDVDD
eukprot:IDg8t1